MENTEKFKSDVIWNFVSIIVLAFSGIALNVLIGLVYDASALGIFNQVFATYIFFSMFAVGGINLSALKLISEDSYNRNRVHDVVWSATLLTILSAAIFAVIYFFLRIPFSELLNSPGVATGMAWITPGLFFFGINKTLLSCVNGLGYMKPFAVFQALRYANLLTGFLIAVILDFPSDQIPFVFSFSEILLFLSLIFYLKDFLKIPEGNGWIRYLRYHIKFGIKGALSGALLELNSRIDVLMLGYFLTDKAAGIYSFAAMLYEGLTQFLIVLQTNYNPHLGKLLHEKKYTDLVNTIRRGRNLSYKYALLLVPIVVVLYPIGLYFVFGESSEFAGSVSCFCILMAGLLVAAGFIPFHNLILMAGLPGWHTCFMLTTVLTNIFLASILIPIYGVNGAATATALSLAISCITLTVIAKRKLKISII